MQRIIKIISIIVIIPFVIYFWPASYGGDTTIMMVQGNSMLPTIPPGSLVVAKQSSQYYVDDIVAYEKQYGRGLSQIVVHRIIDVADNGFVIKGDNNPKKDDFDSTEDIILGKVLFSTPYVGDMISIFRNPIVLVFAAVAVAGIQMEQNRRKERKEKIRCRILGIPYVPPKIRNASKKAKKPNYSIFFAAIFVNILTFILTQIAIENNIKLEGDMVTGFLYTSVIPGLASTLILSFYFGIIFGLYFLTKRYERKSYRKRLISYEMTKNPQELLQKNKSNPMLAVASIGWLLFILMSGFHLITLASSLAPIVF